MATHNNTPADSISGRIWYALLSVSLISLLMLPWLNGIAPGLEPFRFFRGIPFPVGNLLVACYVVVVGLNLWSLFTLDDSLRLLWYRFLLTVTTLITILSLQTTGLNFSQAIVAVWLTLFFGAVGELIFLYSR